LVEVANPCYSDFPFFSTKKKAISIQNAENKDQSAALWLQNLNLSFFY
jgi:hypothetical protein